MKNNLKETLVTLALIVLAVVLLNPFNFWMPDMVVMCMVAITLALFGIFASFMLREDVLDERDGQHRTRAGRNAFLAGSGVLTCGIVVQGYMHAVDPWLVVALITMIVVKIGSRMWSDAHQ